MELNGKLNDEEELIKNSFDEYCEKKYVPYYEQYLKDGIFPKKIMKDLSDLLLPSTISLNDHEKVDDIILGILSEEMGKYEFPLPAFLTIHFSKLLPYIRNESIRDEYIKSYLLHRHTFSKCLPAKGISAGKTTSCRFA